MSLKGSAINVFLPKPNFTIEIKDHSMTYSKPSLCLNHYIAELVEDSTKAYIIDALVSDAPTKHI